LIINKKISFLVSVDFGDNEKADLNVIIKGVPKDDSKAVIDKLNDSKFSELKVGCRASILNSRC
jgi:hypothetical protein